MNCPKCQRECIYVSTNNSYHCYQTDHQFDASFDWCDGQTKLLKIGDKFYLNDQIDEIL